MSSPSGGHYLARVRSPTRRKALFGQPSGREQYGLARLRPDVVRFVNGRGPYGRHPAIALCYRLGYLRRTSFCPSSPDASNLTGAPLPTGGSSDRSLAPIRPDSASCLGAGCHSLPGRCGSNHRERRGKEVLQVAYLAMRIPLVDLSNAGHRDRLLAPGSLPCERSRTFICPVATGAMAEAKGTALPIRAPLSLLRSAGILR